MSRLKSAKPSVLGEEFAVDIGKRGERFVQVLLTLFRRRVQHVEQSGQVRPEIRSVRLRAILDVQPKRLPLENAGVFRKQAKQHPHQEAFQFVPAVATRLQGVVKIVHDPDGCED